jgi:hypothetical protein
MADTQGAEHIEIVVRNQQQEDIKFKIKRTTKLGKVRGARARAWGARGAAPPARRPATWGPRRRLGRRAAPRGRRPGAAPGRADRAARPARPQVMAAYSAKKGVQSSTYKMLHESTIVREDDTPESVGCAALGGDGRGWAAGQPAGAAGLRHGAVAALGAAGRLCCGVQPGCRCGADRPSPCLTCPALPAAGHRGRRRAGHHGRAAGRRGGRLLLISLPLILRRGWGWGWGRGWGGVGWGVFCALIRGARDAWRCGAGRGRRGDGRPNAPERCAAGGGGRLRRRGCRGGGGLGRQEGPLALGTWMQSGAQPSGPRAARSRQGNHLQPHLPPLPGPAPPHAQLPAAPRADNIAPSPAQASPSL